MELKPYLRVAEVAAELGMSPSGVYKLIQRGKLPAIKRSERKTLVPRIALDAYRRRLEHGPPVPPPRVVEDVDLETRIERFRAATGADPDAWMEAWTADRIEDSAENMRAYIRARGILDALQEQAAPEVGAATASAR